ncbi:MAG: hypothetical protein JXJ04_27020 [Spirochaetales bacterium]|nr:hypothetical protein [Spirochaetales bacterium]
MEICVHLKQIFTFELERGNAIQHEGQLWTKMEYSIYLEKPLDMETIRKTLQLDKCVKQLKSDDPHFFMEGFYCEKCKHNIDGPFYLK